MKVYISLLLYRFSLEDFARHINNMSVGIGVVVARVNVRVTQLWKQPAFLV